MKSIGHDEFATEEVNLAALLRLRYTVLRVEQVSAKRVRWVFPIDESTLKVVGAFSAGKMRVEPRTYARAISATTREAREVLRQP